MSRSLKAHILLVLITLIWGSNFVVIKNALADISPLFFNAVRMSLAAVVLAMVFYRELGRLTAGSLRSGLLVGFFSGYVRRVPQVNDRDLIRYIRGQQMRKLRFRESLWDRKAV